MVHWMSRSQLLGALRRHPIWTDAGDQSLLALTRSGRDVPLGTGEQVIVCGEPAESVYLLLEGAVRVYYPSSERNSEVTVKLFRAPAAFGDPEAILGTRWAESVQTLSACRLFVAPAGPYLRIMRSDPKVCLRQYLDICKRFAVAIHTERAAHYGELRDRVVALLVAYANHFGRSGPEGTLIDFHLSQEAIAKEVSSTRRSVVRVLSELYEQDLVRRAGRKFVLPDVASLLEAADAAAVGLSFETESRHWIDGED